MKISLSEAADRLKNGNVIAVPTETVYGLAASIHHPRAIDQIFTLKGRPANNPLIVHVASIDQINEFVKDFPVQFENLAERFWPGPLSIVLPLCNEKLPAKARGGLPTAAFRIPAHPQTLELLKITGPLVMPSANLSGKPSGTRVEHIESDFGVHFPVLDGEICERGLESTVLLYHEDQWKIIRLGALSREAFFNTLNYQPEVVEHSKKPLCPGQLYRHYSPNCSLILSHSLERGELVLGFKERDYPGFIRKIALGSIHNPEEVGENLYLILRRLDQENIAVAFVDMNFPQTGLWKTIEERLNKAAFS